jgi:Asp-tRNA(Asn)/Glu-tRNA(Gln) amidotransferase A subunit family amidase
MVLEAARAADKPRAAGGTLGVSHGLPIPVKDSVDTKALPTSNGTRACLGHGRFVQLLAETALVLSGIWLYSSRRVLFNC